ERKRRISGQLAGRTVQRARQRAVALGDKTFTVEITGDGAALRFGGGARGAIPPTGASLSLAYREGGGGRGDTGARAITVEPRWKLGEPVWTGAIDGQPVSVQVRPALNGFALSYRGVETEAALARLMPAKKKTDSGKQVLCPMPGLVVSIAVAVGQEVKAGEAVAVV